jgi:hypothetical protein
MSLLKKTADSCTIGSRHEPTRNADVACDSSFGTSGERLPHPFVVRRTTVAVIGRQAA